MINSEIEYNELDTFTIYSKVHNLNDNLKIIKNVSNLKSPNLVILIENQAEFDEFLNVEFQNLNSIHFSMNFSLDIFLNNSFEIILNEFLLKNLVYKDGLFKLSMFKIEIINKLIILNNKKIYSQFLMNNPLDYRPIYNTTNESLSLLERVINELNKETLKRKKVCNDLNSIKRIVNNEVEK